MQTALSLKRGVPALCALDVARSTREYLHQARSAFLPSRPFMAVAGCMAPVSSRKVPCRPWQMWTSSAHCAHLPLATLCNCSNRRMLPITSQKLVFFLLASFQAAQWPHLPRAVYKLGRVRRVGCALLASSAAAARRLRARCAASPLPSALDVYPVAVPRIALSAFR